MPSKYQYAVVHPGEAHRDEFLTIGLALYSGELDFNAPVLRKDPNESELCDPTVLVADVGRRYEPDKGNFDHHQNNDWNECAFSLYAHHVQIEGKNARSLFAGAPWFECTITADIRGPSGLAKWLGVGNKIPEGLLPPVEKAILHHMSKQDQVSDFVKEAAMITIAHKVEIALHLQDRIDWIKDVGKESVVNGIPFIVVPTSDPFGIAEYRKKFAEHIAVSVTYDTHDPGWSIFRYDDDPRVDFRNLSNDPRICYVHGNGFLAKTATRCDLDTLKELISLARVPNKEG